MKGKYSSTHDRTNKAILIHSADPQSRPVGIIVFAHVVSSYVRPYVRPFVRTSPLFKSNQTKQTENNFRYWRDCGFGRVDNCKDFLYMIITFKRVKYTTREVELVEWIIVFLTWNKEKTQFHIHNWPISTTSNRDWMKETWFSLANLSGL